jgi:esterase/lipase superfamily enzyme
MNIEYHKWWSPNLGQDMELKVYGADLPPGGRAGKPVIVFPTQSGRFYDYEDFGMVEACRPSIEGGRIEIYTVDSIDSQSWCNWNAHPVDRARRHNDYDRYIVEEVAPFIRSRGHEDEKFVSTGCSMGGYHSANFFFRHPDVFDVLIALSGLLQLRMFVGDTLEEEIYYNTPLAYLPGLVDPWYLEQYRKSEIIVCAGQGPWDEDMLADAYRLREILSAKDVPCWIDVWGHDVSHDWPWWRRQMPYFLHHLGL